MKKERNSLSVCPRMGVGGEGPVPLGKEGHLGGEWVRALMGPGSTGSLAGSQALNLESPAWV